MTDRKTIWNESARLALWAMIATPVTILVHELGHFSVGLASGRPVELHPTSVSGGADFGSAGEGLVALQAAAGPIMTVLMSLAFAYLYGRDRRRLWALAAAAAAVSRLLVTTAYLAARLLLVVLGRPFQGTPNFDEHNVARALGLPPVLVALVATAFLIGLCFWLFRRIPVGRRIPFVLALVFGIAIGAAAWTYVPPPVILAVG